MWVALRIGDAELESVGMCSCRHTLFQLWQNELFGRQNTAFGAKCSLSKRQTAATVAKLAVWNDRILQLWQNVLFGATKYYSRGKTCSLKRQMKLRKML